MTAENFLKSKKYPSFNNSGGLGVGYCHQAMIEFAKYHVEQALKAALEDAPTGSSTDIPSYEEMEDAILNAYPLENIKQEINFRIIFLSGQKVLYQLCKNITK